jgi:hypothetical protein
MYSSTLSVTLALGGDGWSTPRPGRFTPGNDTVPIAQVAGWAPGRSGRVRKISPPPEFDPRTIQLVASCYTDWAISAQKIDGLRTRLEQVTMAGFGIFTV